MASSQGERRGSIDDDDERAAGDGTMSDSWVGPGWWMASDGKWYPPRGSSTDSEPVESLPGSRWNRHTPDGRPVAGASVLSDGERDAERAATRAERAATIPLPEPVSIKHSEDDIEVEEQSIDLRDSVDDRSNEGAVPVASTIVSGPVAGDGPGHSEAGHASDPGSPNRPNVSFAPPVEAPVGEGQPGGANSATNGASALAPGNDETDSSGIGNSSHEQRAEWSIDGIDDGVEEADGAVAELGESVPLDDASMPDGATLPTTEEMPLQHAVLPALVEHEAQSRSRKGPVLLALAAVLALTTGVLGALLLREQSENADLRSELEQVTEANTVVEVGAPDPTELNDEIRTLTLQNEQLQAQLSDMSALVLELPEGRVTEIVVPFTPVFADEENGRFIAMSSEGEYVVWADGADGAITDSGQVSGGPTGLFAAARKAWISTDADKIDIVSLTNEEGLPSVDFGPASFLAPEERAYWTYDENGVAVVRLRKGDGGITASVPVPVPVVDLTIGAGSVWTLGEDGRVYRINTADFTVQAIDAGADLISITASPDALWTLSAADGSLRRVDPVTGDVLVTVPVGRDPIDATFAGNSVWVALRSGSSLIEVDTRTAAVISRTALPGTPTALHQGDSGVFVTMEGDVPLVRVASLALPTTQGEDETSGDTSDEG